VIKPVKMIKVTSIFALLWPDSYYF